MMNDEFFRRIQPLDETANEGSAGTAKPTHQTSRQFGPARRTVHSTSGDNRPSESVGAAKNSDRDGC